MNVRSSSRATYEPTCHAGCVIVTIDHRRPTLRDLRLVSKQVLILSESDFVPAPSRASARALTSLGALARADFVVIRRTTGGMHLTKSRLIWPAGTELRS